MFEDARCCISEVFRFNKCLWAKTDLCSVFRWTKWTRNLQWVRTHRDCCVLHLLSKGFQSHGFFCVLAGSQNKMLNKQLEGCCVCRAPGLSLSDCSHSAHSPSFVKAPALQGGEHTHTQHWCDLRLSPASAFCPTPPELLICIFWQSTLQHPSGWIRLCVGTDYSPMPGIQPFWNRGGGLSSSALHWCGLTSSPVCSLGHHNIKKRH